jgi:hypothetical protein
MNSHRIAAALSILAVTGQSLAAGISLVSGPGTLVVNPNNQRYYADPYNIDTVFYWTEQSPHVLANDLVVSVLPPGSYPTDVTSHSADSSLTIAQGTTIDSFLLYYDPQSSSTVASFAFDDPIVGLITNSATSDADDHFRLSDYLINPLVPGANIPVTHYDARGIELGVGSDFIRWLSPTQIEIHLDAGDPGDQIRVITSAIPEPASIVLVAMGLAAMVRRRRRSN